MFKYELFTLLTLCLFWLHKAKCKNDELQFWKRDPKYWPSTKPQDELPSLREIVDRGGFDLLRRKKPEISVGNQNSESTENEGGPYLGIEAVNGLTYVPIGNTNNGQGHSRSYRPVQRHQHKKERAREMITRADWPTSDRYQHHHLASKRGRTQPKHPEHRFSPADMTLEPKHGSRFKIQGNNPTEERDHNMKGKELNYDDFVKLGESDRHHGKAGQGRHKPIKSHGKKSQVHAEDEEHKNNKHKKPRFKHIYQRGDRKEKHIKNKHHSEYSGKGKVTQGFGDSNNGDDKTEHYYNPGRSRQKSDDSEIKILSPHSIASQLESVAKKLEDQVTIKQEVIGRTIEYNDIVLWKMTRKEHNSEEANFRASANKYADDKAERQIVFIVHGLTIMGWYSLNCLSKMNYFKILLSYYINHLSSFDIYLIPMANPDGVAKASHNHFWNKNMSPQNSCPGVHLDRNFDVAWSKNSSLNSSCSHQYPGVTPFSELETMAIRGVFQRYAHKMVAYLHVHSGSFDDFVYKGDAVLHPKGYTESPDEDKYVDLKGEIDEAMRNASFKVLSVAVDSMYNWYGAVRGTSVDYASTIYGIPYALDLVMQLYMNNMMIENSASREQNSALTEIWQPVFHSIFEQIYKNTVKINERK